MIMKYEFVNGSVYEDRDGTVYIVKDLDERKDEVCLEAIGGTFVNKSICGPTEAVAEELTSRFGVCIHKGCYLTS